MAGVDDAKEILTAIGRNARLSISGVENETLIGIVADHERGREPSREVIIDEVQSGVSVQHIAGCGSIIGDHCSIRDDRKRFSTILPILSEWFRQWICKGHVFDLPGSFGYQKANLFP